MFSPFISDSLCFILHVPIRYRVKPHSYEDDMIEHCWVSLVFCPAVISYFELIMEVDVVVIFFLAQIHNYACDF